MVVISVEVPDSVADKVDKKVISLERLYSIDSEYGDDVVDFGKDGVSKEEFLKYLSE